MSLIIMVSLVCPIEVKAEELFLLENGTTEEDVYYEVYGEVLQPDATTLPVTRYVTYQGKITPPAQLPWNESANGIEYSGVLTLKRYTYIREDNITTATYIGILTYNSYQ